ncbi:MAG: flavodoxin domain-containing protein [Candidatus Helarchaeota archaeon]
MTKKRVLIAYGTRYGSTEELSKEIANILKEKNIESEVLNLKKIKSKNWPSIEDYNGILVGSSIKLGRWMKEPTNFLKKNKEKINQINVPLGLFVSSATAITNPVKAKIDYLEKVIEKLGIKTDLYDTFGAIFDFSTTSKLGKISKSILLNVAKEMSEKDGIEINENEKNVLIDRDTLNSFLKKFIKRINI